MTALHMLQIPLDLGALLQGAKDPSVRTRTIDLGYHVHGWLSHTVGKGALKPFVLRDRWLLAYSSLEAAEVTERIHRYATPGQQAAVAGEILSKPMPEFAIGTPLSLQVRVLPTVRLASATKRIRKGGEVDAWLAHLERNPTPTMNRQQVYEAWFRQRVPEGAAQSLQSVSIAGHCRTRVVRRAGRSTKTFEVPDVSVSVSLTTGAAFQEWLTRGVGRHRAFGFGMMLLRATPC